MCLIISIEDNCIDQEEIYYNNHTRAKNWIATVLRDVKQPGKLDREFWKGYGASIREIPRLTLPGEVLEIAADYTSGGGNRSYRRQYYKIINLTKIILRLEFIGERVNKSDFE